MYRSIVVGTDGSETATAAVRHAFSLGAATGATVHVTTAWSRLPALALSGAAQIAPTQVTPDDGAWIGALHAELQEIGASYGVEVRTHAVEETPVHALLAVAAAVRADLVVVGNRGMHGLRGKLGSVPNAVAHKAPCAVLVVPTS